MYSAHAVRIMPYLVLYLGKQRKFLYQNILVDSCRQPTEQAAIILEDVSHVATLSRQTWKKFEN